MIFFPAGHNGNRHIGPFVDATDGYTRETGLTIPYTSVLCAAQGGAFSAWFTEPGNLSSHGNGYYDLYIDFGELPFCGVFDLVVDIPGARPYSDKIIVIPLELYSYLFFGNPFTFGELVTFSQGIAGNITGNLSGSVGSVGNVRPKKNTGFSNFMFPMFDATTKNPKAGLTVTAERAIDGNPFAPCSASAVELSNGVYRISLSASDLNGNKIMFRFSAPGADDQLVEIITQE